MITKCILIHISIFTPGYLILPGPDIIRHQFSLAALSLALKVDDCFPGNKFVKIYQICYK